MICKCLKWLNYQVGNEKGTSDRGINIASFIIFTIYSAISIINYLYFAYDINVIIFMINLLGFIQPVLENVIRNNKFIRTNLIDSLPNFEKKKHQLSSFIFTIVCVILCIHIFKGEFISAYMLLGISTILIAFVEKSLITIKRLYDIEL